MSTSRYHQLAGWHRPAHRQGPRLVKDSHRSRELIELLTLVDVAYPTHTAIQVILDNHSARISKEPRDWPLLSDRGALQ
jgi:hypothetical protein